MYRSFADLPHKNSSVTPIFGEALPLGKNRRADGLRVYALVVAEFAVTANVSILNRAVQSCFL